MASAGIRHFFTVDVEEYFQVVALEPYAPRERWESYPRRAAVATLQLLELLARHGSLGTFFTVGWLAEREPALMKAIVAAGHEVALHGDRHRAHIWRTPRDVVYDLRRAYDTIAEVAGIEPRWFRPPHGRLRACMIEEAESGGQILML